jgi:hypothetical protein
MTIGCWPKADVNRECVLNDDTGTPVRADTGVRDD